MVSSIDIIDEAYKFGRLFTKSLLNDKRENSNSDLAFANLRLEMKKFIHRTQKRCCEHVAGYEVEFFDYSTFHYLLYEVFFLEEYKTELEERKPLILDCGSNVGLATLYFKRQYPDAEIHCFEPDKQTFEVLSRNISRNGLTNVHLHNVALADREGEIEFFYNDSKPGSPCNSIFISRVDKNKVIVPCIPLTNFINDKKIDLVKLDVEGAEWLVLPDLVSSGKLKNIKRMIIEYHQGQEDKSRMGEFLRLLEDNGFSCRILSIPRESHWGGIQELLIYAQEDDT